MPIYKTELVELIFTMIPVLVTDLDTGVILFVTRPLELMFGYEFKDELVGKVVEDLIPEQYREQHIQYRKQFSSERKTRPMGGNLNIQALHFDGHSFPVEVFLTAGMIQNKLCALCIVLPVREGRMHP